MPLVTPSRGEPSAIGTMLAATIGAGTLSTVERRGYIICGHWNPEHEGWHVNNGLAGDVWRTLNAMKVNEIGVADSIEQFDRVYGKILTEHDDNWCVVFTPVIKDPGNAGNGGGWRWSKWGPYIGESAPSAEYLDDEPGFDDGIVTFHIYPVLFWDQADQ